VTIARRRLGFALVTLASIAAFLAALSIGAVRLSAGEIVSALVRAARGAEDARARIVFDVRLPRALVAYAVGGALAATGGALQGVFRNPLADPGVLGVSAGASLGALIAVYAGAAAHSVAAVPVAACAGALLSTAALLALAGRARRFEVGTLLLAGVAVAQLAAAAIALVVSLALANFDIGRQVLRWSLGGLDGRTWGHAALAIGPMLLAGAALLSQARALDAMLLGDVDAIAIGIDPVRVRIRVVVAAAVLTGVSVAVAGPIAFVGLVAPHLVRGFTGAAHSRLLLACVGAGGAFLLAADVVARTVIAPEELRLGVVTAAVGTPMFVWMLARRRASEVS
jgi:iron complex transport system permease protein